MAETVPADSLPAPAGFVEALRDMRAAMVAHPWWRKVQGTPAENDLPVRAASLAMNWLNHERQKLLPVEAGTIDGIVRDVCELVPDYQAGDPDVATVSMTDLRIILEGWLTEARAAAAEGAAHG